MTKRLLLLLPLGLAACVAPRETPPPPPPAPVPAPVVRPAPPPPSANWADLPLTPGSWVYEGAGASTSSATYGVAGAPQFRLYCGGPTRGVSLQRYGAGAARTLAVRTSFGARSFALSPGAEFGSATLAAAEPFLDNMIFSRGRISVEVAGTPTLVLPSWAEAARVVEDCRR